MRLIDADNAIIVLEILADKCADNRAFEQAVGVLKDVPTVDAEPKRGRWILNRQGNWACSLCGNDPYHDNMKNMNYCPNCGADMREVEE